MCFLQDTDKTQRPMERVSSGNEKIMIAQRDDTAFFNDMERQKDEKTRR